MSPLLSSVQAPQARPRLPSDRPPSRREEFVEQFVIGSGGDQPGASSGPEPEDTRLSIEQTIAVFDKGIKKKRCGSAKRFIRSTVCSQV